MEHGIKMIYCNLNTANNCIREVLDAGIDSYIITNSSKLSLDLLSFGRASLVRFVEHLYQSKSINLTDVYEVTVSNKALEFIYAEIIYGRLKYMIAERSPKTDVK